MNFLGHALLARHGSDDFLFGNLIADGIKGAALTALSTEVACGVRHHRRVDAFVDHHAIVLQLRQDAPREHRRVIGIALDMMWDHFLSQQLADQREVDALVERSYGVLRKRSLPARLEAMLIALVEGDWLRAYGDFAFTCRAIAGVGRRLSGPNRLAASIPWLEQEYASINAAFVALWPELDEHFVPSGTRAWSEVSRVRRVTSE